MVSIPFCRGPSAAGSAGRPSPGPRAGCCGAPSRFPGENRPHCSAVITASSPLFTSVFSTLITRFIAFAWGKPGDGGAGDDPSPQAPAALRTARGKRGGHSSAGTSPHRLVFSRISGGKGRSRSPQAAGTRHHAEPTGRGREPRGEPSGYSPAARPQGAAAPCCTNAICASGGEKKGEGKKEKQKRYGRIRGFSDKQRW